MTVALALEGLGPADIVDASLAYHLAAGVELVLVPELPPGADADVADVVSRHVARGAVLTVPSTEPADRAAARHGAAWLARARVGELWWPRGARLDELLAAVPAGVGAVQGLERRFVASPGDAPFFERTTLRCVPSAPAIDPRSPERPAPRVICRVPDLSEQGGPWRGWFPVEVLCFPVATATEEERADRPCEGVLVEDARVRDALRMLAAGEPLVFPRPGAADDPDFPIEVAGLVEAEVVAASRRMDGLEGRLAELEGASLRQRVRRAMRVAVRRVSVRETV